MLYLMLTGLPVEAVVLLELEELPLLAVELPVIGWVLHLRERPLHGRLQRPGQLYLGWSQQWVR